MATSSSTTSTLLTSTPHGKRITIVDIESVEELDHRLSREPAVFYPCDWLLRLWKDAVDAERVEEEDMKWSRSGRPKPRGLNYRTQQLPFSAAAATV